MGRKKFQCLKAVFAVCAVAMPVWNQLSVQHYLLPLAESFQRDEKRAAMFKFTSSVDDNDGTGRNANDVESHSMLKPGNDATAQTIRPTYRENEVLFLNTTDASTIKQHNEDRLNDVNKSPYSIDVLVVGSRHKVEQAQKQRETWASHKAVRNFFLSTELDDTDPKCMGEDAWSRREIRVQINQCRRGSFWKELGSVNGYTNRMGTHFARYDWLNKKANPTGWLCAQRRFATSFTRLLEIYATPDQLPDYLILADDDTYVNIDTIVRTMIIEPREHKSKGLDQEQSWFPTEDVPVVTAGCRVRLSIEYGILTFPFGGYGTFFSHGSLKRLIHPLNCDGTNSPEFEAGICNKLLQKDNNTYPMNGLIGEQNFFQPGDSLNRVLYKYSRNIKRFCLHSDWFMGYVANFYNISRHTTSVGQHNWFDPRNENVQESRLHQLKDNEKSVDSEIYRRPSGDCKYGLKKGCAVGATVCHHMDSFIEWEYCDCAGEYDSESNTIVEVSENKPSLDVLDLSQPVISSSYKMAPNGTWSHWVVYYTSNVCMMDGFTKYEMLALAHFKKQYCTVSKS